MKKVLLSLISVTLVLLVHAQTIVSTSPQNKKVILEQFTGTG
jgi:hypothetical protein